MSFDLLLAPSPVKGNPKVNVTTTTALLGFAVMGGAGAFVWWQMNSAREAQRAAEAAEEELLALQEQRAWEQEEVARPGDLGPAIDRDAINTINYWAKQWRWGRNGVEIVKGSWVWETKRVDALDGTRVKLVKGKDRTFTVMPKQGGEHHRLILKASGQVIEKPFDGLGDLGYYGAADGKKKGDPREDLIQKDFRKAGYKVVPYTYEGEGHEDFTFYKAKDFKAEAARKKDKKLKKFVDTAAKTANKFKISTRRQLWTDAADADGNYIFALKFDKNDLKKWEKAEKARKRAAGKARGEAMLEDLPEEEDSSMGIYLIGGAAALFGAWYFLRR